MSSCQKCGREMDYIGERGQWRCPSCRQYQQAPPPAEKKSSSKTPMIAGLVIVVILIIAAAAYFLFLAPEDEDDDIPEMTYQELLDDWSSEGGGFKSLEPGDKVKIKDEIYYITYEYNDDIESPVTYIWFESAHRGESPIPDCWLDLGKDWCDYDVTFQGDLTDEYFTGDVVIITITITEDESFLDLYKNTLNYLPPSRMRHYSTSDNGGDEVVATFPTIDMEFKHSSSEDKLDIKHIAGDPLDWAKYKMIITNASDDSDIATLLSLTGQITAGEHSVFTNKTHTAMNDIKFCIGKVYEVEIYNIKENKRVYHKANVQCVAA